MSQDAFPADKTDYHVHCHRDGCAAKDMTLSAVYAEAVKAGLREIAVVKHYSHSLPNGKDGFVSWKRTLPAEFDAFLEEFRTTPVPAGLRVLSAVETELLNAAGDINIPPEQAARVDLALLSVHWLPDAPGLTNVLREALNPLTLPPSHKSSEELAAWLKPIREIGPEPFARAMCEGNANAIRRHHKVRVLAHLDDGFIALRGYCVPVDDLSDDRLLELIAPVIEACVQYRVLWELTPDLSRRTQVVREANRRGVAFTGTVDAHFLANPAWGHILAQHGIVEDVIRRMGVTRGRL